MVPAVVAILISLLVADAYVANVGVACDNSNTSEDANVNSRVISPCNEVSIIDVEALPPKIPNHCRMV